VYQLDETLRERRFCKNMYSFIVMNIDILEGLSKVSVTESVSREKFDSSLVISFVTLAFYGQVQRYRLQSGGVSEIVPKIKPKPKKPQYYQMYVIVFQVFHIIYHLLWQLSLNG